MMMALSPGKLFIAAAVTIGISSAYLKVASDSQALSSSMSSPLPPAVMSDIATRDSYSPEVASQWEKARHQLTLNRYFSAQTNNEALPQADHFAEVPVYGPDTPSFQDDQAIWRLIEKLERDQRIFAYEALSLKLRWLEKNVTDTEELKLRADSLIKRYNRES